MEELYSKIPEARRYFSFAFVRDPCERARSFFEDKLLHGRLSGEWNTDSRYYGLRKGMSFDEYCRWLDTPFGSDPFAERHWLSQYIHLQVDGDLPDYVRSYENLQENWRWVLTRLGVPYTELAHLNKRRADTVCVSVDGDNAAILHRRYARDFDMLREVGRPGIGRDKGLGDAFSCNPHV